MKGMKWLVLLATAMITGCAQSPPEQQTINDAASALGGRDKILAVKTLILEGGGRNGNLGQGVTPEATSEMFTLTDYKRVVDVAAGRVRVEQTRTPNFTFFQGQQAQKQVFGIDGDLAYNIAADGTAARAPNAAANDRRMEIYHHPLTLVRAALDPNSKLSNPRTTNSQNLLTITTDNNLKFTLGSRAARTRVSGWW